MKVVAVGGGTGLSTLLRGLKNFPVDITAVVTITDEGGSSGVLREELNVPPPGDVRNTLVALASDENILSRVFSYRFKNGSLTGHPVGNVILAALTKITGSFTEAVARASDILAIRGRVLPVSNEMANLVASFSDGSIVEGETRIVEYGRTSGFNIVGIELKRTVPINPLVDEAIREANVLIFGPGSLYTSIIANFLVPGFKEAVKASNALKLYISNIMTQPGETTNYTLRQHVSEVERYLGTNVDVVLHSHPPSDYKVLERYGAKDSEPVEIDFWDERLVLGNFSAIQYDEGEPRIRHDPMLIAHAVFEVIHRLSGVNQDTR